MNAALSLIPAKVRLVLYVAYAVAGLVVSSVAVYFTAVGHNVPLWVGGAAAVLGSLAAPFGAMAGSNINRAPAAPPSPASSPGVAAPAVSDTPAPAAAPDAAPAAPATPAEPPADSVTVA